MKIRALVGWSVLSILGASAGAMAIPLDRAAAGASPSTPVPSTTAPAPVPLVVGPGAHFSAGQALLVDARLGHASLSLSAPSQTFLFASVTGSVSAVGAVAPPVNLAIVLDRSGSMQQGNRITNAIDAALGAIARMRDVDTVTLVTFDTGARVVVAPTRVTAASRPAIEAAIRGITVMGDTCISCGLEEAMRVLSTAPAAADSVNRVLLLSDGQATHGVKDVSGLKALAGHMRDAGFSATTLGVDVDYDEKVMSAIAIESNGLHHFVRTAAELPTFFAKEFEALATTVARDSEAVFELDPGVELLEVYDRSYRVEGRRVRVAFGTFETHEEKTVLLRLAVSTTHEGVQPVAHVALSYRDLAKHAVEGCAGDLAVSVKSGEPSPIDPFVGARIERSKTAQALNSATVLFGEGKIEEAGALLAKRKEELAAAHLHATSTVSAVPLKASGRPLEDDYGEQKIAVDNTTKHFTAPVVVAGQPKPVTPNANNAPGKAAQKNAVDIADPFSR